MSPRRTNENPLGLEPWEGEAVSELGVKILQQNVPLNEALKADTIIQEQLKKATKGDVIHVVMELTRGGATMSNAVSHDGWKRTDSYTCTGAAVISADGAVEAISEQRERVELALEKAAGTQRLGAKGAGEKGPVDTAAEADAKEKAKAES